MLIRSGAAKTIALVYGNNGRSSGDRYGGVAAVGGKVDIVTGSCNGEESSGRDIEK